MELEFIAFMGLVLSIFIGFKKKINTGIVSIFFAFILGKIILGMSEKDIIKGWPTNLFFILLGMTFLFSIAKVNGTLELVSKKICILARGNRKLLPIIFFMMCSVISALGPGPIVVTALMAPIGMGISREEDIPELLVGTMIISGSLAGGMSPLSPSGMIANSLANEQCLNVEKVIFLKTLLTMTLLGAVLYVALGGYRLKRKTYIENKSIEFTREQIKTIVVLSVVVFMILFFKWDIGLTAFSGAALLLFLGVVDPEEAVQNIPWSTLILISGVTILINVVNIAGGIDMLSNIFGNLMTEKTAPGVLAVISGCMSSVSSASGVVMPTLIPTVPNIVSKTNASPYALINGIVIGAHIVTFSPLSTLGALTLSSVSNEKRRERLFIQLLIIAILGVGFAGVLGLVGLYA